MHDRLRQTGRFAALPANSDVLQELRFHMSVLADQIGTMNNTMRTGTTTLQKLREAM